MTTREIEKNIQKLTGEINKVKARCTKLEKNNKELEAEIEELKNKKD